MNKISNLSIDLIKRCQSGEQQAQDTILKIFNQKISLGISTQYKESYLPNELEINDLIQEGLLAFLAAVNEFDIKTSLPDKLFNFCMKKAHWRIKDYIKIENRKLNRYKSGIESDEVTRCYDPDDVIIKRTICRVLDNMIRRDQIICLELLFNKVISDNSLEQHKISLHQCKKIYRNFRKEVQGIII